MKNTFVIHGLTHCDGESIAICVIETSYQRHELIKILKKHIKKEEKSHLENRDVMHYQNTFYRLTDPKIKFIDFSSIDIYGIEYG